MLESYPTRTQVERMIADAIAAIPKPRCTWFYQFGHEKWRASCELEAGHFGPHAATYHWGDDA